MKPFNPLPQDTAIRSNNVGTPLSLQSCQLPLSLLPTYTRSPTAALQAIAVTCGSGPCAAIGSAGPMKPFNPLPQDAATRLNSDGTPLSLQSCQLPLSLLPTYTRSPTAALQTIAVTCGSGPSAAIGSAGPMKPFNPLPQDTATRSNNDGTYPSLQSCQLPLPLPPPTPTLLAACRLPLAACRLPLTPKIGFIRYPRERKICFDVPTTCTIMSPNLVGVILLRDVRRARCGGRCILTHPQFTPACFAAFRGLPSAHECPLSY